MEDLYNNFSWLYLNEIEIKNIVNVNSVLGDIESMKDTLDSLKKTLIDVDRLRRNGVLIYFYVDKKKLLNIDIDKKVGNVKVTYSFKKVKETLTVLRELCSVWKLEDEENEIDSITLEDEIIGDVVVKLLESSIKILEKIVVKLQSPVTF
jgi:hypothetical protein